MDRQSDHPSIHSADILPNDDTLAHPQVSTSRRRLLGLAVATASSLLIPAVSGCGETNTTTPDHVKDAELITTGFVGEITAVVDTQTPPDYGGGIQPDDPHTAVNVTVKVEQRPEAASTFDRYDTDSTITWFTMKPRAFIVSEPDGVTDEAITPESPLRWRDRLPPWRSVLWLRLKRSTARTSYRILAS